VRISTGVPASPPIPTPLFFFFFLFPRGRVREGDGAPLAGKALLATLARALRLHSTHRPKANPVGCLARDAAGAFGAVAAREWSSSISTLQLTAPLGAKFEMAPPPMSTG